MVDPPVMAGAVALSSSMEAFVKEDTTVVVPSPDATVVMVSFPDATVVMVSFPEETVVPVKEATVVPPAATVANAVVVPFPSEEQSTNGMAKQVKPTSHPSPEGHAELTQELTSASV